MESNVQRWGRQHNRLGVVSEAVQLPTANTHRTSVIVNMIGTEVRAVCECGWRGPLRSVKLQRFPSLRLNRDAERDAETHRRIGI